MDAVRQIRFAIAPFFLYGSLLLGAVFSGRISTQSIESVADKPSGLLVAVGAGLVASAIPLGFLIGAISILFLRIGFLPFTKQSYEVLLSETAWKRIWSQLQMSLPPSDTHYLYAGATFDHELLSQGVHEWIVRRWSAFNIYVHSCTALFLAYALGPFLTIPRTSLWCWITLVSFAVLAIHAVGAWRHTMGMIDFQSYRQQSKERTEAAPAVPTDARVKEVTITAERITFELMDGRVIGVPLAWSWRLSEATPAQRNHFEIIGDGHGVHWPEVDEDLSVEGMLHGIPARRPKKS